ncbi:MAG: DUF3857 domain-containing protein [bacterium]
MQSFKRLTLVCLSLLLFAQGAESLAKKKPYTWGEVSDSDWAVTQDSARGILDGAIIFEKMEFDDREYYKKDRCYRTIYRRVRILTDKGRSFGDVNVPFVHFEQEIEDIQGRTLLRDGTVLELHKDNIYTKEAVRVKREALEQYSFSLPGVTSDCVIEYMIRYKTPTPSTVWVLQNEIPVLAGECHWLLEQMLARGSSARRTYRIFGKTGANYVWQRAPDSRKVEIIPDRDHAEEIVFKIGFVPPFDGEPFTFPEPSLMTRLICYYGSVAGSNQFWTDMAMDLDDYFDEYCKKNYRLRDVVDEFPVLDSDSARLAVAFNWVRENLVNSDFEPCMGDYGRERKPDVNNNINEILEQGCGNSRDVDILFMHMLNLMGIKARLVLLRGRADDLFVPEAKYWQFDEVLIGVPQDNGYVMCSPGHYYNPIDLVPWYCEAVDAVLVGGSGLFHIPCTSYDRNLLKADYHFTIAEDLEISGQVEAELAGQYALDVRSAQGKPDSNACSDLIGEYLSKYYSDAELGSVACTGFVDCAAPLKASYQLAFPPLERTGDRILLRPLAYLRDQTNPFVKEVRKFGVVLPFAYYNLEKAAFALPTGWVTTALPNDTSFINYFGECEIHFEASDDTLYVERQTAIYEQFVRAAQYGRLRSLYEMREQLAASVIVLEPR